MGSRLSNVKKYNSKTDRYITDRFSNSPSYRSALASFPIVSQVNPSELIKPNREANPDNLEFLYTQPEPSTKKKGGGILKKPVAAKE